MRSIKTTSPAEVKAEMIIMNVKAGYSTIDHYELNSEWLISKYEIRLFLRFITKWYQRIDTISVVKPEESELLTDEEIKVYTATAEAGYAYGYESEYDFESGNYVSSGRQRYMPFWIERLGDGLSNTDVIYLTDGRKFHRETVGLSGSIPLSSMIFWEYRAGRPHELSEESERFFIQRMSPLETFFDYTPVIGNLTEYPDGTEVFCRTYSNDDLLHPIGGYNSDGSYTSYDRAEHVPVDPTGEESGKEWEDKVLDHEFRILGKIYKRRTKKA